MSSTLTVPELGENVDSVDVVKVLVAVGDRIAVDQPVVEVETEKAAVEIPADRAGVVAEVHVSPGDTLTAGSAIITVEDSERSGTEPVDEGAGRSGAGAPASAGEPPPQSAPERPEREQPPADGQSETMVVPELGENVESVDVVAVLVEVGQQLAVDQPVVEVETEKASVEVPSTVAGEVAIIHAEVGGSLRAGDPILTVNIASADTGDGTPEAAAPDAGEATPEPERQSDDRVSPRPDADGAEAGAAADGRDRSPAPRGTPPEGPRKLVPAAPTVRRFAREVGVDIAQVAGSGPGHRITIDDVKAFVARSLSHASSSPVGAASPELPELADWGPVRREPMSKVRQATARNMARAWVTVPQVTNHDEADITDLEADRQSYRSRVEAAGGKLTVTSMLVKVVASALKVFPTLNAAVDAARQEIVYRESIHVGVAVDTERGLLVPVIRDADRKNITAISVELEDLARRSRDRKLLLDEMQGASFTISNLGGIGGTSFTPIVNWPEVAILGVSRAAIRPRWSGDAFEPRLIMPLSLSYDHRLVDGADAARFLRWVCEALEQPLLLALEG